MSCRLPIICLVLLLAACTGQGPQRPSQRKGQAPEADSSALALLALNQKMAQAADEQLAGLVKAQEESYALYEGNAWMHIISFGDKQTETPKADEEWSIRMKVYALDGQLLEDTDRTFRIMRHELPYAVDRNIDILHHGARAKIYAPWYSAFGMQGTAHVEPYENVIIEIELR